MYCLHHHVCSSYFLMYTFWTLTGHFWGFIPLSGFFLCTKSPRLSKFSRLPIISNSTTLSSSLWGTQLRRGHCSAAAGGWRWALCTFAAHISYTESILSLLFQIQMKRSLKTIPYYKSFANNECGLGSKFGKMIYILCHQTITYVKCLSLFYYKHITPLFECFYIFFQSSGLHVQWTTGYASTSTLIRDT